MKNEENRHEHKTRNGNTALAGPGSCDYSPPDGKSLTIEAMRNSSSVAKWLVFAGSVIVFSHAQVPGASSQSRGEFTRRLITAAIERTHHSVHYVSEYIRIPYPGGDVPADTGVCTDEIIRAYRAVGVDLQKEVHEDMLQHFATYPSQQRWRLARTDANIDHRRVPNLMVFFQRKGESLPLSHRAEDYRPGDLVTWDLGRNIPHIGIVVDQKSPGSGRYMIVHNIGEGPKMEDVLFDWKITGHYRYYGPSL